MASQLRKRRDLRKQAEPRAEKAATTLVEPEEILIADPRGGLTPAQRGNQRLAAVLQSGHREFLIQAVGDSHNIRGIPDEQKTSPPSAGTPDIRRA